MSEAASSGILVSCMGCQAEFVAPDRRRLYCFVCSPPGKWLGRSAEKPALRVVGQGGEPHTVPHFREWASRFRLKSGAPFVLEDYQALFLEDLFARDEAARPVFSELWLVVPEGNGKTTFVALIVLYVIEFVAEAWVPVAASARDQAVDLTYRIASGFVQRNRLEDAYRLHPGYRQIVHRGSLGSAKIFASDAASGDGVDPTLAIIEELHRLASFDLYDTWAGKLDKSDGQLVIVSTAGEPGGAFEQRRERLRRMATDTQRGECYTRAAGLASVLHEWAIPVDGDPDDLELVEKANPYSGKTLEVLARNRAKASWNLPHWRRFVCNLPTRDVASAITEAEWDRAYSKTRIPEGEHVAVGVDLGWKWDTTGIVPFWARDHTHRYLGDPQILTPPRDGGMLHPDEPKKALLVIHERNPIGTVVMDMHRGEELAAWCEDELAAEVVDRPQSNAFAAVDYDMFTEALRNGWLHHTGDAELRRHALNAITRVLPNGGARFDRPAAHTKNTVDQDLRVIDALTAASMVHSTIMRLEDLELDGELVTVL